MPDSHGVKTSSSTAPSSAHSNVAPARSELKVKVAVLSFVIAGGVVRRNVSGSGETVHSYAVSGPAKPASLSARTSSRRSPAGMSPMKYGVSQEPHMVSTPTSMHSKDGTGLSEANSNVAKKSVVIRSGPEMTVAVG